mmetsp:Transcript_22829/g.11034  ORF Transcript_22829/g.11034 Transcript_22829/m.11034 type:complete len:123 (+) Transcript_22829:465-833(+)
MLTEYEMHLDLTTAAIEMIGSDCDDFTTVSADFNGQEIEIYFPGATTVNGVQGWFRLHFGSETYYSSTGHLPNGTDTLLCRIPDRTITVFIKDPSSRNTDLYTVEVDSAIDLFTVEDVNTVR